MNTLDFSKLVSEEEAIKRYNFAAHAMQSGVAMKMNYEGDDVTPKHLRVGVNSALVDFSALAELLMFKGVITPQEYLNALMLGMEREAELYQKMLTDRLGVDVKLG